jgi:adenylate cyclase
VRHDRAVVSARGSGFLDHTICGYVFRNRASGEQSADEQPDGDYVHVTPDALKFFSLAKQ